MKSEYVEIKEYSGEGYQPVIDFEAWRVAILNYIDELERPNITNMQKHLESDEVFVLLKGECTLFIGGSGDEVGDITPLPMKPFKLYNVKKGTWHTHTLMKDTMVLIVENRDTCDANSPTQYLTPAQKQKLL